MSGKRLFCLSICVLFVFPSLAAAQIGFGVTRQNGVVTGGMLSIGGFVNPGRTGVVLGVNTGGQNLIGVNQFTYNRPGFNGQAGFQGGQNQGGPQAANRQPSPAQFVQAAARFDRDRNHELDKKELADVAKAVLNELAQRGLKNPGGKPANAAVQNGDKKADQPTPEQLVDAFVKRCMDFDKNEDESLNAAETKQMAAALIRSLS